MVDEDGSEKIEFGEFLSIIKGGAGQQETSKKGQDAKKGGETGAIYNFFKQLTTGDFKLENNENAPFQLFISGYRRKMILQSMMSKDPQKKRDGDKILENYKKQLAERMAREKIQLQALSGQTSAKTSSKRSAKDNAEYRVKRLQSYNSNEVPDPDILKQILEQKSRH